MHDHMELLRHATKLDAKLTNPSAEVEFERPIKKTLFEGDDPFGSNKNNRKVAERIAKQGNKVCVPTAAAVDPVKAAADVKKSKAAGNVDKPKREKDEPLIWRPNAG